MNLEVLVKAALQEDLPQGDLTTDNLHLASRTGLARLIAKQELVLSGAEAFGETFRQVDASIQVRWSFHDGSRVQRGAEISLLSGDFSNLLKGERTALNFLAHLSGIATLTSHFVARTKGTKAKIIDTRKTTPGYRSLEKGAVVHGGGENHRMSLSDAILIKENHIRACGGITNAVKILRESASGKPIEVEVTNVNEVQEALSVKADRLLLDNMTNEQMKTAVEVVKNRALIEASGNMSLDRIESVAKLGVDFISVGALTHSAPAVDLSLLFEEAK